MFLTLQGLDESLVRFKTFWCYLLIIFKEILKYSFNVVMLTSVDLGGVDS